MPLTANQQLTEVGCVSEHDTRPDASKSPMNPEDEDEEEDEEEDVDFNPFLKGTPSPEASSSLSSEIVGDSDHAEEEITLQAKVSSKGPCEKTECRMDVPRKTKKRKSLLISQSEAEAVGEKENGSISSGIEVYEGMVGDLANTTDSLKPMMGLDDEDAICRRTRARYSLASFTLDELEAFLQETDDDDDLQNVDDEEEYRKFLAAVLKGEDGDGLSTQGNENIDDEDEDNDADFEIELEEMLESDYDEGITEKTEKVSGGRRPETRQNRRQKASAQYKKKLLEQTKRPLRPLLPVLPNVLPVVPFPSVKGKTLMPGTAPTYISSTAEDTLINGFTPHQIAQLHCLMHEHLQLLIQVFSLSILDSSRQHIASQAQGLIFEMLHKHDEAIAFRSEPYPDIYFCPPYTCSSVPDTVLQFGPGQSAFDSSSQTLKGYFWVPSVSGPVLSVLDVAPLKLAGKYMDEVYTAIQEYRKRCLEFSSDTCFEREPLFPFPFTSFVQANAEASKEKTPSSTNTVPSSPSEQPTKKSLAVALVESTKKQSVALVPKEISKLVQRFFPFFNPSLFPHKPPSMAVANRVLFTDAEDELLALGMMEYNSDWKAIQQRFLPCKTKHQIFVRQKNRCSSKAPENPIKDVRRFKTSPLTAKEIECIQEGLKVFKLDWVSVWKFLVPHRDPALLRRQWRIALGTQRCYKQDAAKKEKRRLYELRKRCRTADLANWHLGDKEGENAGGGNNSGDDYIEYADEGYVHEAFLADWRPGGPNSRFSGRSCLNIRDKLLPNGSGQQPNHPLRINKSQVCLPPYRARRRNKAHLVKLAPDLPPVNLPPSVRIISQSAFKSVQCGSSANVSVTGSGVGCSEQKSTAPLISHLVRLGTPHLIKTGRDKSNLVKENVRNMHLEESHVVEDERGAESDLQMHPLLFQAPEDGRLPYYPLNTGTGTSSSFSFFSANQPQLNLSLFHNPRQVSHVGCFNESLKTKESSNTASSAIDFHPLLKISEHANGDSVTVSSTASKSNEKANDLDLEIHLSSSSTKKRALGSRDMTSQNLKHSANNAIRSGQGTETQHTNNLHYCHGENYGRDVLSGHFSDLPSTRNIDDIGDHSNPGIVMEQEELSDSDEEIEEHVEFECEEMTDSEGEEGSGCEQIPEMQEKEVCGILEENARDRDSNDQRHESRSPSFAPGSVLVPRNASPFLKLGLITMGKDTTSSSWLSLNSCAPGHPARTKHKNTEGAISEAPSAKDIASPANRSFKKTTPTTKKVAEQKDATDVAQQLSLSPTVRKPRKCTLPN
ncbi:hypothetical protein Patl1_24607 [Pistacia atlantica]|uniref:Uncharacterized protein n=1 Tax=Pistacia atlantica TaxID=434234 RepID=A0ACC0ZW75_9ROSI|nr:hypothetical protein Patl1_24607 [Pistacia atlantica]